MRTIGLLGGMSWESSAHYYRLINEGVRARRGGTHSAPLVMVSVDFAEIAALQHAGDWAALGERMAAAARTLSDAGAEAIVLCTNTMHKLAAKIERAQPRPLLHIADAAGTALVAAGHRRVGLLGTAFTMEQPFYRERLAERYGLEVIVPGPPDRAEVHRIIYDELVRGVVHEESRARYRAVITALIAEGAEAIVLGCTEIMLLVDAGDSAVPLFDTTALHAAAAVAFAVSG
ncbi:aspartate racemase [Sphingomonas sp. BE138]|uniref:aspartate/glutamate racemase family protein n=1 Tax=Sphingomonas sp. BE138 TaxID=2817845 RepID=UPI002865E1F3|nr:aspartate/glutamate racemase family protein [Sphingomonas sp. BE138]MDR6789100.1 aspartate racemase [Sphingomonas sp. BE138]